MRRTTKMTRNGKSAKPKKRQLFFSRRHRRIAPRRVARVGRGASPEHHIAPQHHAEVFYFFDLKGILQSC